MNKKDKSLEEKVNRNIQPENVTEVKCDLSFTKKTILGEAMDVLLKTYKNNEYNKKDH